MFCADSKYAADLEQVPAFKTICLDPALWRCEKSGQIGGPNLWLNLSDGYVAGGRRFWDGSHGVGSSNGSLDHYKHMKALGKEFPLVVKMSTLLTRSPWVWSYAPDEDDTVNDPYLDRHLRHWGICLRVSRKRKAAEAAITSITHKMFEEQKFTDAVVVCGPTELRVHRAVLAAASPVMERMFSGGMQEANEARICIADTAPEVAEAMIRYIYTREVVPAPASDIDDVQLFAVATMYELDSLAEEASRRVLAKGLNESNALQTCRVVRRHANSGNARAQALWEKLYAAILKDKNLLRLILEMTLS